MKRSLIATAFVIGIASNAQAHTYHHRHHVHPMVEGLGVGLRHMLNSMGPRPSRWCGWAMRQMVGSDPGPDYNLARNWSHYGRPASGPGIGVIVVWPHHVGIIRGQSAGLWVVESGNDGHAWRSRARSVAGAIAFREP